MLPHFGASPQDWANLELALGLGEDLLPVVSNPHAVIAPRSEIVAIGKVPSRYNHARHLVGIPEWTSYHATAHDIEKWSKEKDYGICIQTRNVRAIDVDVPDEELSCKIQDFLFRFLQHSLYPRRHRAGSGKVLFAFKLHGELSKRVLTVEGGIIEFLANGQQFVAHGTHPSGARYEWDWNGHDDFPTLTPDEFERLWSSLASEFAVSQSGTGSPRKPRLPASATDDDPLLPRLSVLSYGREGQAYIDCPFKAEHTMDSGPTQTAYFPRGGRGYEQGHFKCLHAHCAGRNDGDFLDALGLRDDMFEPVTEEPDAQPARKRGWVKIRGGGLSAEASKAEGLLMAENIEFYQRGQTLVRPVIEKVDASRGRKTKVAHLVTVTNAHLTDQLCYSMDWLRYDARSKKYIKVNPPLEVAATILSRFGSWPFHRISGIITTPTLRSDGSVLLEPGHDPDTGLLLLDPPAMPPMPESPTYDEGLSALRLLLGLLTEFPFINRVSRSVALSCLITPVVRGAFGSAPMHVIRAPSPGSGKSYLLDIASAIATGQPCPVMAAGRSEEETEKRLGAALIAGQPIISIDNVNGELGGDFLCQLIERPIIEVRILGKSERMRIESRSTIFATGNNIRLVGDMTRRVLLCMLDAESERPELRQFSHDPVEAVLADRGQYIAAALTLVRAYICAGRPSPCKRLASFEGWSDTVRSALVWLGEADPVESVESARREDPHLQAMNAMFGALRDVIGVGHQATASVIIKSAYDHFGAEEDNAMLEALKLCLYSKGGTFSTKELGKWLASHRDRIACGVRLQGKSDANGHATKWWVEAVAVDASYDGSDMV